MKQSPIVFLDLEETVIDDWYNQKLINHIELSQWLAQVNVDRVGIFSFAVSNERDVKTFTRDIKPRLEQELRCEIVEDSVITCDEMFNASTVVTGLKYDGWADFCTIKGKTGAFADWVQSECGPGLYVLVDDVVGDTVTHVADRLQSIVTINVGTIVSRHAPKKR